MKVVLPILTTLVSMAMLQWLGVSGNPFAPQPGLGNSVYYERSNIFVGKIMPSQYIATTEPVKKPCQCRYLCLALNCTTATWLGLPDNGNSYCLISQEYFSHLDLTNTSAEDYSTHFQLEGQTPGTSYSMTFYWFKDDYEWHEGFYKIHPVSTAIGQAHKTCVSEGARLVTFETEEEFQSVTKLLIHSSGATYWVGLYRSETTDPPMWQYVNGAIEARKDHMLDNGKDRCFAAQYYQVWSFIDSKCGATYHFVCERNFN